MQNQNNLDECINDFSGDEYSEDVYVVIDKLEGFSDWFDDMLFEYGSLTFPENKMYDSATIAIKCETLIPIELQGFVFEIFNINVEDIDGGAIGCFNLEEKTLTIAPDFINDDIVILHEMIHMYEFVLDQVSLYYHDVCMYRLYESLKNRVDDLDKELNVYADLDRGVLINQIGGTHDLLFVLKSFDLDLRKGYPIGTIFGYL